MGIKICIREFCNISKYKILRKIKGFENFKGLFYMNSILWLNLEWEERIDFGRKKLVYLVFFICNFYV